MRDLLCTYKLCYIVHTLPIPVTHHLDGRVIISCDVCWYNVLNLLLVYHVAFPIKTHYWYVIDFGILDIIFLNLWNINHALPGCWLWLLRVGCGKPHFLSSYGKWPMGWRWKKQWRIDKAIYYGRTVHVILEVSSIALHTSNRLSFWQLVPKVYLNSSNLATLVLCSNG